MIWYDKAKATDKIDGVFGVLSKEKDQPCGWSDFLICQLPTSDANT